MSHSFPTRRSSDLNDEAEAALLAMQVPENRIHIERFGVQAAANTSAGASAGAGAGQFGAVVHEAQAGDAAVARVTLIRDGLKREFAYSKDQPSILDAATAAGVEVPYSCTSGVCGT